MYGEIKAERYIKSNVLWSDLTWHQILSPFDRAGVFLQISVAYNYQNKMGWVGRLFSNKDGVLQAEVLVKSSATRHQTLSVQYGIKLQRGNFFHLTIASAWNNDKQ